MAKFNISITRDVTESTIVDVEADNLAEAIAKALCEACEAPHEFDWTPDDCIGGEPYHAGGDECPACNGSGEGGQAGEDCECGQCGGTGAIEGGLSGDGDDEECPVCDGTGALPANADTW